MLAMNLFVYSRKILIIIRILMSLNKSLRNVKRVGWSIHAHNLFKINLRCSVTRNFFVAKKKVLAEI